MKLLVQKMKQRSKEKHIANKVFSFHIGFVEHFRFDRQTTIQELQRKKFERVAKNASAWKNKIE